MLRNRWSQGVLDVEPRWASTQPLHAGATLSLSIRASRRKYAPLWSETLPRVIAPSEELERLTRQIKPLLDKGERRTPEEEALCCLSLKLMDDYQQAHRSIPEMKPHELLQALLEESGKRPADLLPSFGSRSRVSDAVNPKRTSEAKRLGEFFSVSLAAFI